MGLCSEKNGDLNSAEGFYGRKKAIDMWEIETANTN